MPKSRLRVGIGYDIHRLAKGRKFTLGGVQIPHSKGLVGHSDGDALLHALTDALLGAAGLSDIGDLFPDTDRRWKGASSLFLLKEVVARVRRKGLRVVNVDAVVLAEEPKIGPYREKIRRTIAAALGVAPGDVGLKAKTMEGLGPIGQKKALSVTCVALVEKTGK